MKTVLTKESGATAIEYGLIAGLIALGIVGSLVGTRGSLNAIFGQVSSGVGSAAPAAAGAPTLASSSSARAPYWQAKTLSSRSVTTGMDGSNPYTNYTYNYADGSRAIFFVEPNSNPYPVRAIIRDVASKQRYDYYADANGTPQSIDYGLYADSALTKSVTHITSSSGTSWSGGQPASVSYTTYDQTTGNQNSSTIGPPSSDAKNTIAMAAQDWQYFKDVSQ